MRLPDAAHALQLAIIYLTGEAVLASVATREILVMSINGRGFESKYPGVPEIHLDSTNIPVGMEDTWTWPDMLEVVAANFAGLISQDLLKDTSSGNVADLDAAIAEMGIPVTGDSAAIHEGGAIRIYKSADPNLRFNVDVHIERTPTEVAFVVPQYSTFRAYNAETAAFLVKTHVGIVIDELCPPNG